MHRTPRAFSFSTAVSTVGLKTHQRPNGSKGCTNPTRQTKYIYIYITILYEKVRERQVGFNYVLPLSKASRRRKPLTNPKTRVSKHLDAHYLHLKVVYLLCRFVFGTTCVCVCVGRLSRALEIGEKELRARSPSVMVKKVECDCSVADGGGVFARLQISWNKRRRGSCGVEGVEVRQRWVGVRRVIKDSVEYECVLLTSWCSFWPNVS